MTPPGQLRRWEVLPLTAVLEPPGLLLGGCAQEMQTKQEGGHLWVQPTLGIKQHREGTYAAFS